MQNSFFQMHMNYDLKRTYIPYRTPGLCVLLINTDTSTSELTDNKPTLINSMTTP
jgi:hypothetical protein